MSDALTPRDREFLQTPRLGFLTVDPDGDWPVPVPVWFEWTGKGVQLFSSATAPKTRRIEATPRASLVAANSVGEPEYWIAVVGSARVEPTGGYELVARLAARYWDLGDPARAATLESWRSIPSVRVIIDADEIKRYG